MSVNIQIISLALQNLIYHMSFSQNTVKRPFYETLKVLQGYMHIPLAILRNLHQAIPTFARLNWLWHVAFIPKDSPETCTLVGWVTLPIN